MCPQRLWCVALPFTDFPSLGGRDEIWGLSEEYINFKLKVYLRVAEEKGKEEALSWLKDGFARRVNASAWMPYFSSPKAFVVLIAWIESRHHGENVSIEEFSDARCVIRFRDHIWFKMYDTATQFRSRISRDAYREIFKYIWQDRAKESGWDVAFSYEGYNTKVVLTRDGALMHNRG